MHKKEAILRHLAHRSVAVKVHGGYFCPHFA